MTLEDFREDVQRCMRCGFCRVMCPLMDYIGWETGSPRGRMQIIKALIDGQVTANDYIMDRIFKCANCGYCLWRCPPGVNTIDAIKAARTYLVEQGCYPRILDKVDSQVRENGSIYGFPEEARTEWIEFMGVEDIVKSKLTAEIVYFVGCVTSTSGRVMNIAKATSQIFDKLDLDWKILGNDELCCGYPLLLSGKTEYVTNLAKHNVELVHKARARTVVTTCPGCYRTFVHDYPLLIGDLGFDVYHISQFLHKNLDQVTTHFHNELNMTATYHDPCDLGRLSDIYEPPRIVLKSIPGLNLQELPKNRSLARCCGGGGMLKATNPNIALDLATKKIEDAHSLTVDAIISSCASCKQNIQDGIDELGDSIQMLDLTEIVAKAMGFDD